MNLPSEPASGAAPAPTPSLVGRATEVGVLAGALERAAGGEGAIVLVSGEAGVGKSRLTRELLTRAREQGARIAVGRAAEGTGGRPFGMLVELCRCGESSNKPFCDGTHEHNRFNGAESDDRRPYAERAPVERTADYSLADDGALCVSAGFCGTRTTSAWQLLGEASDPEQFARMRDMVWQCPSGRLVLRAADGRDIEPALEPGIAVVPGGPLWVRGGVRLIRSDGSEVETRNRMTLCRCGESRNKPFCDRSHEAIHFDER